MRNFEILRLLPQCLDSDLSGGLFEFQSPIDSGTLKVIASNGLGWDHVSVSRKNRCPNWQEMCHIKDAFFDDNEVVIQYHPKREDYVNNHNFCLHMWRPQNTEIPTPPPILVGIKGVTALNEQNKQLLALLVKELRGVQS